MSPGSISGLDSLEPWATAARLYSLVETPSPPVSFFHSSTASGPEHNGGLVLMICTIPLLLSDQPPAAERTSSKLVRRVRSNCACFATSPVTLTGGRLFRSETRTLTCGFFRYCDHSLTTSACSSRSVLQLATTGSFTHGSKILPSSSTVIASTSKSFSPKAFIDKTSPGPIKYPMGVLSVGVCEKPENAKMPSVERSSKNLIF